MEEILRRIELGSPDTKLFDSTAHDAAKEVATADKKHNKPTQLRRFFDELCMWQEKVIHNEGRFNEYVPFIRMMNAKVAYAKGRNLIDENFRALFAHCVQMVNDPRTLLHAKLFMEAFVGFYKIERKDD
jgi:CRISPR-associated protein Csm2